MKTELPCAIVRDLLPSYVEGLTEQETSAAVKAHLESCDSCRRRYEAMTGEEDRPQADSREVDYLKQVRNRNRKRVLWSFLLAVALMLAGIAAKVFWIGHPNRGDLAQSVYVETEESGAQTLHVKLLEPNSAMAIRDIRQEEQDGVVALRTRVVLASPLCRSGDYALTVPLEDLRQVTLDGRIIWQDGVFITGHIQRLFRDRTPYVGNPSAVNQLISDMDLDAPHTLSLQTDQEPYGLTVAYEWDFKEYRRFVQEGSAYLLLALVENLGEVHWTEPSGYTDSLTLEEANAALPGQIEAYNEEMGTAYPVLDSVKDYGGEAHTLQMLYNVVLDQYF